MGHAFESLLFGKNPPTCTQTPKAVFQFVNSFVKQSLLETVTEFYAQQKSYAH